MTLLGALKFEESDWPCIGTLYMVIAHSPLIKVFIYLFIYFIKSKIKYKNDTNDTKIFTI